MDEDTITVLHLHNPHLMWIEVKKHDTFTLRQVGIFGVVPRQASMVNGERVCTKSDRWDPRANEIVEEFSESQNQLVFKSTYRLDDDDEKSSIFSQQPHIFGEISLRKPDGTKKQLINCLDNSVYAYKSKNEFWEMLTTGKINTVLKEDEEIGVLCKIVRFYKDKGTWNQKKQLFCKHLSTEQIAKVKNNLKSSTSKLTVQNLEKHLILTNQKSSETGYIIEKPKNSKPQVKKYQEFRGNGENAPVEFVEDVIKQLTGVCDNKRATVYEKKPVVKNNDALNRIEERNKLDGKETEDVSKEMTHEKMDTVSSLTLNDVEIRDVVENSNSGDMFRGRGRTNTRLKKPDPVSPSNKSEERLVAYGPPVSNLHSLIKKNVPKMAIETRRQNKEAEEQTWTGAAINWEDEEISVPGYDSNARRSRDSDDFGNVKNSQRIEVNVRKSFDNDDFRNNNASSNVSDDSINLNDDSLTKSEISDLNEGYNNVFQSKQDQGNLKDLLKLRIRKSSSSDTYKVKHDSNVVENKDKNTVQKNSRSKLLDIIRKRNKVAKMNDSFSSSNDNNSENKETTPVRKERRVIFNENSDSDQKPNDSYSSISNSKDTDQELDEIQERLDLKLPSFEIKTHAIQTLTHKTNVNPYKNLDGMKSIFVDELVQPLILAHSKHENKILPRSALRDIPFKSEIHKTLCNKLVKEPNRLQSVSWPYILRGHSMILISAANSGKTLGYIPPICNLVLDYNFDFTGLGPICIVVCATAMSVSDIAEQCRMFLNHQRVIACYPGIDSQLLVTDLLNGCDILVSTPSMLYRLLGVDLGVDLRRLTTVVFEDCERLANVYELEVKAVQLHVKQMLKSRTDKQIKVQFILASREWCDFMTPLAKKAPDTIVTFAAFHECVLYSKTHTSVSFVKKDKKIDAVVDFLNDTDDSKLTVIVCRSDDEVELLKATLTKLNHTVYACDNQMDIHELRKFRAQIFSSILICCDGNLSYLNVTYANYLVHFSMPAVYTRFCRRFAVLNDNYASIFGPANENVKIKILLEDSNVEQLPKILNFVRRCSSKIPDVLNEVATKVLEQKDLAKAEKFVPICDNLMSLGECANSLSCQERHAILVAFDEPIAWMPHNGIITFKIIHYNSAISYSARLLTHTSGDSRHKYPETYGTLCLKLGMFFSKDKNKRLHGEPSLGDICAVSARKNFMARCQVLKIIDFEKGKAKNVIINLIDEEFISVVRAVELYYLPEEFKDVETRTIKVRLAGMAPQDKDLTFSELAVDTLKRITDDDEQLYLKGRVVMTIGNTIFVDSLEACADLSALCETVVKYDFKNILLKTHAIANPDHLSKLSKLCELGNLILRREPEILKVKTKPLKKEIEHRWAHLEKNDWSEVVFSNTINAGKFFVRLQKFDKCIESLVSDIKKHVNENPEPVGNVSVRDTVLAEFPDDLVYERAIIEEIIDDAKVKCFFVDNADWRYVPVQKLKKIPEKIIKQIPFQSIECRLIGIKPHGEEWTEFSTNWLHDNCLDEKGIFKRLYVKYYTKEKAEATSGHKYGVILVDTTTDNDLVINKRMLELNLALVKEDEIEYMDKPLDFVRDKTDISSLEDDFEELIYTNDKLNVKKSIPIQGKITNDSYLDDINEDLETPNKIIPYAKDSEKVGTSLSNMFLQKPIRSFPLVSESDEDSDKWDVYHDADLGKCFGIPQLSSAYNEISINKIDESKTDVKIINNQKNSSKSSAQKLPAIANALERDDSTNKKVTLNKVTDVFKKRAENTINMDYVTVTSAKSRTKSLSINDFSNDSDDTSSVSGIVSKKTNTNQNETSVLDSDDTQSISTETDKDRTAESKKELKVLDSDDLDEDLDVLISETPISIIEVGSIPDKKSNTIAPMKVDCVRKNNKSEIATNVTKIEKSVTKSVECKTKINKKEETTYIKEASNTKRKSIKHIELKYDKPERKGKTITITESTEPIRTPQLLWCQKQDQINIKIQLVVDSYELETENRSMKFSAYQNEVRYAFDIELYGLINHEKTKHANKGQYILVNLFVMMTKVKWLKLSSTVKNWIVYDFDSVDTSSEEETSSYNDALKLVMDKHERDLDVDADDDVDDTSGYRYRD